MDNPPQAHICSSGRDARAPANTSYKVWLTSGNDGGSERPA